MIDKEHVVENFRKVHGNRYDYSNSKIKRYKDKINVRRRIHGDFAINIHNHMKGSGCPLCAKISRLRKIHKTCADTFITKARKKHGNKYNYSRVKYVDANTPIDIICPIHGIFSQEPNYHLSGNGCKRCALEYTAQLKKAKAADNFALRANVIHNNKYDYSNVVYVNSNTNVEIICPKHGSFLQTPSNHLAGNNCPKCNLSQGEEMLMRLFTKYEIEYVYQKHIGWLGLQSYDFYLPKSKIAIEFQGEQHFQVTKRFGGEKAFETQQKRDRTKLELSKEHNVNLVYYCEKKFAKYYDGTDLTFFTNTESLIEYIRKYETINKEN